MAMPGPPHETDSPLVAYPYRVLSCPVASQGLQLVSGRRRQDAQFRRGMQLQQFAQRHSLDDPEAPGMLIPEKLLGFLRREALNHTQSIARVALYVNRFHAAPIPYGQPRAAVFPSGFLPPHTSTIPIAQPLFLTSSSFGCRVRAVGPNLVFPIRMRRKECRSEKPYGP